MSLDDLKFKTNLYKHGMNRVSRWRVSIPLPQSVQTFIQEQEDANGGLLPDWAKSALRIGSIALGGGASSERNIQFFCTATSLPGTQVAIEDTKINGHTFNYATGIERANVQFNFMVSQDLYEKEVFDKWLNFMIDEKTRKVSYFDDYVVDIRLEALNDRDEVVYTLNMIDAFPATVDALVLDKSVRDSPGFLTVLFKIKYVNNDSLPDDSSGLPGNLGGLVDGLTSGNLEQAAYSARMLAIQAKRGQFTGEAAALYGKINDLTEQSIGFSAVEVDKMAGGLSTMVNNSSGTSDQDKSLLNSILTGL